MHPFVDGVGVTRDSPRPSIPDEDDEPNSQHGDISEAHNPTNDDPFATIGTGPL